MFNRRNLSQLVIKQNCSEQLFNILEMCKRYCFMLVDNFWISNRIFFIKIAANKQRHLRTNKSGICLHVGMNILPFCKRIFVTHMKETEIFVYCFACCVTIILEFHMTNANFYFDLKLYIIWSYFSQYILDQCQD